MTVWFHAIWRMATSKSGVSALELQRTLGISSYQSVWTMLHRLRQGMGSGTKNLLSGTVEVDETFFGGPRSGIRGRGTTGKTMVAVAVEHAGGKALGRARTLVIPNAQSSTLSGFLAATVESGSTVVTDGLNAYHAATTRYVHDVHVVHGSGAPAHELLPGVHLVISLTKRWMLTTHQGGVQPEHLAAYLDEFVFRFNRRTSKVPGLIFYRLVQAMLNTSPAPVPASSDVTEHSPAFTFLPSTTPTASHVAPHSLALPPQKMPWRKGPPNG
ncbi:IS1595 family transposase [Paeniglutamicibacter cryotolerans]|uniref:IS1595 family transposase n=1 Tax=Paeniglutamicibacter cryotolerans TaxID=670079 RepID=UPI002483EBF6|nr:IS1595 family transposase [Paeniglutamicibacter cryotolerans]